MLFCFFSISKAFGWKFVIYLLIDAYVWLSSGEPGNYIYTAQTRESIYPETEKPLEQEQKTETDRKRGMDGERTAEAERQNKLDCKVGLARLVSLPVTSLDEDLCLSFWYQFTGEHAGTLHIRQKRAGGGEGVEVKELQEVKGVEQLQEEGKDKQRDGMKIEQEVLLWKMEWHETKGWKEGRILMPHADKPYKVTVLSPQLHCVLFLLLLISIVSLYVCVR